MDLRGIDLNLLLAFEALAATGSVSQAARRLALGQPAMSAALGRLRRLTGDRLFERTAGAMQPTPRARAMIPGIASALAQLRATLAAQVEFEPRTAQRCFTIASTDYTSAILAPRLMAELARDAPGIDLRIIGYDKNDVPELIARGEIDLALGVFDPPPPDAVRTLLWHDRFVGVARAGHPLLAAVTSVAYAAASHALISVKRDAYGRIDAALTEAGLERRVTLVLPHMLALPPVLIMTDLVAAVPARVARQFNREDIVTFDLPFTLPDWQVEMLWNPAARSDQASRWLRGAVVAAAAELGDVR